VTADNEDEARAMGTEMCDKLLANPVIEEYELSIAEADDQEGRG
jgi:phosphoribosylformylglycinamidine (FGAM) synthase PurS component